MTSPYSSGSGGGQWGQQQAYNAGSSGWFTQQQTVQHLNYVHGQPQGPCQHVGLPPPPFYAGGAPSPIQQQHSGPGPSHSAQQYPRPSPSPLQQHYAQQAAQYGPPSPQQSNGSYFNQQHTYQQPVQPQYTSGSYTASSPVVSTGPPPIPPRIDVSAPQILHPQPQYLQSPTPSLPPHSTPSPQPMFQQQQAMPPPLPPRMSPQPLSAVSVQSGYQQQQLPPPLPPRTSFSPAPPMQGSASPTPAHTIHAPRPPPANSSTRPSRRPPHRLPPLPTGMGQGQAPAQAVAGMGYNGQAPQQQYQQQQFGQGMQSPVSPGFAPVPPSHSQSNWSPPQSMHPLPLPPVHPQRLPSPQPMQMPIPAPHQQPLQQPVPIQQPQPVQLQPGPEQVPILAAEPPALPPPPPYTETVSDAFSVNVPATPTSPHQSLHSVHVSPPRPTPTFVVHNADPGMSPAPMPGGSEKYEYRPEKYTYTPNRGMDGDVGPRSRAMDMGMEAGPSSAGPSNWAGPSSWSA